MRYDDWNDPSLEDEDELLDPSEGPEPVEKHDWPMTLLRGILGVVLMVWFAWEGYHRGQIYGSVDRSHPETFEVAYLHTERSFWSPSATLYGTLAGSTERVQIELFTEQSTAFFQGDTATVFKSPGCDCLVTLQQVEESGPFHRIGSTVWSWQGAAAVAFGLYSLLLLVMGGLGVSGALRGLSFRLLLVHETSVGIFAVLAVLGLGWGYWLATGYTSSAGALYAGVDPEKTAELTVTRTSAHHGWVRSRFSGEVRAADGRTFEVSLNRDEYLGLRVGGPMEVVLLDGGTKAEIPRVVKAAQPTVRLFGRPLTWHIFLTPLGVLLVLFFAFLTRRQIRKVREILWLRRLWQEEIERRYAGIDRVYWPRPPS